MIATPPDHVKEALLRPNLGLDDRKADKSMSKDELPPTPPPEEEGSTAASFLVSTGASALSLLGSGLVVLGSAAVSALIPPAEPETKSDEPVEGSKAETASEPTLLGSISNAVLTRASSLASTAANTLVGSPSPTTDNTINGPGPSPSTPPRTSSAQPPAPAPATIHHSSTFPIQLTASGEPFSSDPSISAMQRIPDPPCGLHAHHQLQHCCSAPDVLEDKKGKSGQSGNFHRVEQLVKGTKRVVKDIKNVL